jgi:hypothetical protein
MRKQAYMEELQKLNKVNQSTQINSSFKKIPEQIQKCSVGTQKELDSVASILCGKRMRICKVKGKKSLLSPLAS